MNWGPAFSGGHDLKELTARRADADRGRAYFRHIMLTCSAMMQQIVRLPQPVIAAVQGARRRGRHFGLRGKARAEVGAELSAIAADRAVRAVVLTAKGPAFSGVSGCRPPGDAERLLPRLDSRLMLA